LTACFPGERGSASSPLAFFLHLFQKVSGESPYQAKHWLGEYLRNALFCVEWDVKRDKWHCILQTRCPFCHPTDYVKSLKKGHTIKINMIHQKRVSPYSCCLRALINRHLFSFSGVCYLHHWWRLVLFLPPFVCLSVCERINKKYGWIFMKFGKYAKYIPEKTSLNFGRLGSGVRVRILAACHNSDM